MTVGRPCVAVQEIHCHVNNTRSFKTWEFLGHSWHIGSVDTSSNLGSGVGSLQDAEVVGLLGEVGDGGDEGGVKRGVGGVGGAGLLRQVPALVREQEEVRAGRVLVQILSLMKSYNGGKRTVIRTTMCTMQMYYEPKIDLIGILSYFSSVFVR